MIKYERIKPYLFLENMSKDGWVLAISFIQIIIGYAFFHTFNDPNTTKILKYFNLGFLSGIMCSISITLIVVFGMIFGIKLIMILLTQLNVPTDPNGKKYHKIDSIFRTRDLRFISKRFNVTNDSTLLCTKTAIDEYNKNIKKSFVIVNDMSVMVCLKCSRNIEARSFFTDHFLYEIKVFMSKDSGLIGGAWSKVFSKNGDMYMCLELM